LPSIEWQDVDVIAIKLNKQDYSFHIHSGSASKAHLQQRIESFIAYFNATMAKPFRWTMKGKPLVA
jgi:hypothetical protein